jgi:hypothetical protein
MSDNVVKLTTVGNPVSAIDAGTIEIAEELLDMARRGEIQGLAFVTIKTVGAGTVDSVGSGWAGNGVDQNVHAVLGGLVGLQARFIKSKIE